MNGLAAALGRAVLLAQQEIIDGIREGMQSKPATNTWLVVLLAAAGVIGLLLLARQRFNRGQSAKPEPQVDYLVAAAGILGLSRAEREDLKRLAARAGLSQPAALLLSPANLASALRPGSSDAEDPELRERLAALCLKLFGRPLPESPAGS